MTPPVPPPDVTAGLRELHIAFNVANRRAGGTGPACAGPDCEVCAALQSPADPSAESAGLRDAAQKVIDTFKRDEAQGYRSRDRQFAIEILEAALRPAPPPTSAEEKEKG